MIQSHLIANTTDGVQYLFYDTVLNGKHVFTACGVGRIEDANVLLTPIARETMFAAANHAQDSNKAPFSSRFQEIGSIDSVSDRIRQALDAANDKELIFFVCNTPDIYDSAVAALHVQWVFHGGVQ